MEKRKTPLSFHVIYWIMNVLVVLLGIVSIAIVIFYVMLWTDFFGNNLQLHAELPGKVNFLDTGVMKLKGENIKVELVEATCRIHFFNTPTFLARHFTLIAMGVSALGLFMLWTFRQFIVNVRKGLVFTISNIILLQRISYSLIAFWLATIIYKRTAYYYISERVHIDNVEIISDYNNYGGILMSALFIWVLSHIFIRGLRLKEEQDLTV
jgi:hypothetical protein